jgi:hypothetical protein
MPFRLALATPALAMLAPPSVRAATAAAATNLFFFKGCYLAYDSSRHVRTLNARTTKKPSSVNA